MKLCKDCKYYEDKRPKTFWDMLGMPPMTSYDWCSHPELVNPCTGYAVDAEQARMFRCGIEARNFEPAKRNA